MGTGQSKAQAAAICPDAAFILLKQGTDCSVIISGEWESQQLSCFVISCTLVQVEFLKNMHFYH